MEHNVIDDYIKCEIDLEAVSTLLNKVYEKEKIVCRVMQTIKVI